MRLFSITSLLVLSSFPLLGAEASSTTGTLTYYLTPAQKNLRYTSPASLARTYGLSYLKRELGVAVTNYNKAAMGHAVVQVECTDSENEQHHFFSGISGQNIREVDQQDLFEDKIGLGVLFKTYADGYIQDDEKVAYLIGAHRGRLYVDSEQNVRRQRVNFLSFEVTADQCDELVAFQKTYQEKRFATAPTLSEVESMSGNEPLFFTLAIDPYESYRDMLMNNLTVEQARLGGGCTSYAQAFVKVAGLHEAIFDQQFMEHLEIGESLIGEPARGRRVSPLRALRARSWAPDGGPTRKLAIYHPEYVWNFIEGARQCLTPHRQYPSDFCNHIVRSWVRSKGENIQPLRKTIHYGDNQSTTVEGVLIRRP
jgi:hypothetical protein